MAYRQSIPRLDRRPGHKITAISLTILELPKISKIFTLWDSCGSSIIITD